MKAKAKNFLIRNIITCISFVGQPRAEVLIFPRSLNGTVKVYVVVFMVRRTNCWHYRFSCVSTVVIYWHCDVLASYNYIWSAPTQLFGHRDLYKHISYQLAWLTKLKRNFMSLRPDIPSSIFQYTCSLVLQSNLHGTHGNIWLCSRDWVKLLVLWSKDGL